MYKTSELDELFRILNSIKGFKLKQPQWSNTTKITDNSRGPVTSSDKNGQDKLHSRSKRAIPLLAIAQGTTAIGSMLIKGINALVDVKRASSFNNTIKMLNTNVEITHNRLVTLENRTSMLVEAIMPVLKDLKS